MCDSHVLAPVFGQGLNVFAVLLEYQRIVCNLMRNFQNDRVEYRF